MPLPGTAPGETSPLPGGAPGAPAAPPGGAQAGTPTAPSGTPTPAAGAAPAPGATVVLLELDSNPAGREQAASVGALLLSYLAESPGLKVVPVKEVGLMLGAERLRRVFREGPTTCPASCLFELSHALNVRYVISGRLDRFGNVFVLSANLFDARAAHSMARPHADAANDADVPAATRIVSEDLLSRMVKATKSGPPKLPEVKGGRVALELKGGSNFISSLEALSPSVDLELGFRFHPEWIAFVQIGVAFVRAQSEDGVVGVNVVPSVVGMRHLYNVENALQPYWGLGLGVQLSFGDFGPIQRSGLLPTIIGVGGLQFLLTEGFGVLAEIKTDLAQATLGVIRGSSGLGLHLDLSAGLVFRF